MARFSIPTFPLTITEGSPLTFMLTPSSALTGTTTVRWDIIQNGRLAALDSDFANTTGLVNFANGATAAQPVSITIRNDAIRGEDRSFSIRLTEVPSSGAEAQIGQDHAITLIEDDTALSFSNFTLPTTIQHDTLVLGSSYTYPSVTGAAGDDTFIITKHQNLDLTINDTLGANVIKFDTGVSITHFHVVDSIRLTLGTGAEITVTSPAEAGRYQYQLGDGVLMDYAGFVAEIRSGGFENDADGNATTELSTAYVITAPALAPNSGTSQFTVSSLPDTITEGADLSVTLTPSSALTGATDVRWDIIQNGRLAALDSDFAATTGTLSFANGATAAQTVSITIRNDAIRGEDRTFSLRLTEVASDKTETQIGQDRAITLIEDDTAISFKDFVLPVTSQHDTLVLGSSYTYPLVTGAVGNDTFIITKHQTLDLSIIDMLGTNVIKFDTGVSITHVHTVEFVISSSLTIVDLITLTLGTGAEITVINPAQPGKYQYQLGDGVLMDYTDFVAEIRSGGFKNDADGNATTELNTAIEITTPALVIDANDAPVLDDVTGATITDNANSDTGSTITGSLTGTLSGTDADTAHTPASLTFEVRGTAAAEDDTSKSGYDHRVDGIYGDLYYNEGSGAYEFVRDEAAINALNATQNVNDTFAVRAVDPDNAKSEPKNLVFTVVGANDTPTLTTDSQTGTVAENVTSAPVDGIILTAGDVDTSQTPAASDFTLTGDDGLFEVYALAASGEFGLRLKSSTTAFDYETATKKSYAITVMLTDSSSATATQNLTVNLENVNETDATVTISKSGSDAVAVGDVYTATVTADADGVAIYSYQWLRDGSDISGATSSTYTLTGDDAGTDVSVRISYTDATFGTKTPSSNTVAVPAPSAVNNAPTLAGGGTATITEDSTDIQEAIFTFSDSDDTNASITFRGVAEGQADTAPATPSSSTSNGVNAFTVDDTLDGAYGEFTFTRNDTDGTLTASYNLTETSAAVQGLSAGDTLVDKLTVFVGDDGGENSGGQTFTVTINGVNDAPVQSANTVRTLNEGGMVRLFSSTLEFTDVDNNTRAQVVYVITEIPDHGELQLSRAALAAGDTFTDEDINNGLITYHHDGSENHTDDFKFRVENQDTDGTALTTASDGGGNMVFTHSFTITAVNDAPTLVLAQGSDAAPTVTEDATTDVSAVFDFGDVDVGQNNDNLTIKVAKATSTTSAPVAADIAAATDLNPSSITGEYGLFTLTRDNNTGKLTVSYNLNEVATNVQDLSQGDTVYDQVTIFVGDGTVDSAPQTFTVSITGANDVAANNAPTLTGGGTATITEDSTDTQEATFTFSDSDDTNASITFRGTAEGQADTAPATPSSSTSNGVNAFTDVDTLNGAYGSFTFTRDDTAGTLTATYNLTETSAAVQGLSAGDTLVDKLTVFVGDDDGENSGAQTFTVTINGANDAPVLGDVTGAMITDNANSDTGSTPSADITGTLSGTDADDAHTPASLTFEVTKGGVTTNTTGPGTSVSVGGGDNSTHSVVGTYGTFYYNEGNGKYIFVRDEAAINALDAGQSRTDTFAVRAVDPDGLMSDPKDVVFTVVGADDAPTTTPSTTITTTDRTNYTFKLDDFGFADPDGDTFTSIQILTLPAAGSLMLNNGLVNEPVNARDIVLASQIANFTYVPANGDQNVTVSFTYRVRSDSTETATATSATATLNITVINHVGTAPTLGSVTDAGSVDENSAENTPISNITFTPNDTDTSQTFAPANFTLTSNEAGLSDDQVDALFKVVALPVLVPGDPQAFGLQVKSGAALNFEDKNSYAITVTVRDDNSLEASDNLTVTIDNVDETDATVAIARVTDRGTRGNIDTGDVYEARITPDLDLPTVAGNYTYQWLNNGSEISGATEQTYTLAPSDAGDNISVRIDYTDPADSAEEEVSSNTVKVNAPATGALTSSLSLTGSAALAQAGGRFILGNDSINDADGGINGATGIYTVYYSDQTHNNFTELMTDTTKGLATKIGGGSSGTFEITKAMFEKQIYGVYTVMDNGTLPSNEMIFTGLGYFDAGDAAGTATQLAGVLDGNTLNGVIEDSSDNDFYTFTLAERKLVTFTETGTTTNNLSFRLVDSVTGAVQSPNDTTNGDVTTLITTLEAGDHVVRVSGDVAKYSLTYEEAEPLVITSDAMGNTLAEKAEVPARTVVYKATGTSPINNDPISWSLTNNPNNLFAIDSSTGIVTLRQATTPDYSDTNPSYTFTVGASSPSGRTSSQVVTISIAKDISVDTGVVTSGASGITLTEGVAYNAGTVLYTGAGTSTAWLIHAVAEEYNELFTIDPTNGLVTLHMPLTPDYEDQASYSITLEGNSIEDFRFDGYRQTVVIQVRNVNDVAPVITSGDTGTALTDGMRPSAAVYTAAGRYDVDAIVWGLSGADAGLFDIASNGAVTLKSTAATPDHETKEDYTFTIVARSGSLVSEQVVTVQVTDVNDVAPTITSGGTATALIDGERPSAAVYTAEGLYDVDAIVWSLSGADAGLFDIDAASGAVTLKDTAPTPIYATKQSYNFTVEARSGSLASVTQDVTIQVANPNVAPPVIISSPTGTALIDNDQVMPERVVYKAVATVTDSNPITWRLTGTDAGTFNIAPNGDVTFKVATTPNYEAETSYSFTINAQSSGGNTTQNITIQVTDVDEPPRITSGNTGDALPENDPVMSDEVIYQAAAMPVDNSTITWSLTGTDAGLFNIAPNGEVKFNVATTPDFEDTENYTFTVMAAGEDGSSTQDVTVAVTNINDVAPTISSGKAGLTVLTDEELANAGTVVYRSIGTSDAVPIVWDLSVNPGNLFAIDPATGVVTLREAITPDFETAQSYSFTVRATSGSLDPVLKVVTVQVTDIDDSPKITSPRTVDLAENVPHSTVVYESMVSNFTVGFWDFDRTVQNGDYGLFDIHYQSGEVTLKAGTPTPDFETKSSYTFTITALGISGSVTLSQTITIQVTNVDEAPTATPRSGITTTESMPYPFSARDFGFADPDANDDLHSIRIVNAPTAGSLMLGDTTVINSGDTVLESAISTLTYTPDNVNADTNVTFTYKVISTSGVSATAESDTATLTIAVTNVDAIGTAITLANENLSIAENTNITSAIKIADLDITDVDGGSYGTLELAGTDAGKFVLNGTVLSLRAGTTLSHANDPSFNVRVQLAEDTAIGVDVVVNVTDVVDTTPVALAITSGSEESWADDSVFSTSRTFYDADGAGGSITWSLKAGTGDVGLFSINPTSGEVTFLSETRLDRNDGKYEYDFTVVATAGQQEIEQAVKIKVNLAPAISYTTPITGTTGTTAAEAIEGTDGKDVINANGGGDLIFAKGKGDTINLGAGADTVVVRFESDAYGNNWSLRDGGDTINNFQYGVDRILLLDISADGNPINNYAEAIADTNAPPAAVLVNASGGIIYDIGFGDSGQTGGDKLKVNFVRADSSFSNWISSGNNIEPIFEYITPDDLPSTFFDIT